MCGVPRRGIHRGQQAGADGDEMSPVPGSVVCLHTPFICPYGGSAWRPESDKKSCSGQPVTHCRLDTHYMLPRWQPLLAVPELHLVSGAGSWSLALKPSSSKI